MPQQPEMRGARSVHEAVWNDGDGPRCSALLFSWDGHTFSVFKCVCVGCMRVCVFHLILPRIHI